MKYFFSISLILFAQFLFGQEIRNSIDTTFISSTNDSVPYQLMSPPIIDSSKSYPLILWLHGKGERGNDNEKQMTLIKKWLPDSLSKEEYHSFLLSPQCSEDRMWNNYDKTANEITFEKTTPEIQNSIIELIEDCKSKYNIDSKRIYIIGISMGGFGVFDMITRYPNYFAAAIPICGGADPNKSNELKQTPIWAFHGEKDNIVDKRHTIIPMQKIADSTHILTTYPNKGHDTWNKAFKESSLLNWIFQHKIF